MYQWLNAKHVLITCNCMADHGIVSFIRRGHNNETLAWQRRNPFAPQINIPVHFRTVDGWERVELLPGECFGKSFRDKLLDMLRTCRNDAQFPDLAKSLQM